MTYRVNNKTFEFAEEEIPAILAFLFAQVKINDVENALSRMNIEASAADVEKIAFNLYDEIFFHDEEYWELEDKNIYYLAERMGLKNTWETA